ncbi:MAG TPA: serine/threonine-protein kinase [Gemmataceae bacterium]|nr:serine/threonine-protein kinase [Gemmataceae bacterium]
MSDSAVTSEAERDQRLARLLDELTRQLRQGERPDIEAAARQHPDLADELRQLWAAVQIAEEFAHSAAPTMLEPRSPAAELAAAGLPRAFGKYELLEVLGRGGMGVVYKARQKSPERIVALKMVLRGEWASAEDLARFQEEAEAAGRLDHPAIVPVYEVGQCDGQAYFSMRYVEGTTLARLVAPGPLPPREAARYVAAVARAVHHAHQNGVLHRDLKPSNVLIDRAGQPYVTDFGLAKRVAGGESLTRTGAVLGTPSYMAPEQATDSRGLVSPASDVYSLGAILYELLTGRPPFQAATPLDTLLLVLEQPPVPPRRLNPNVDPVLELICLKCLQKKPELRYRTAAELADDLEAFLRGDRPSVWSVSLAALVSHWFSETHHAAVLENWGLLWMWHSLKILLLCLLTNALLWWGVKSPLPYLALWGVGLVVWAAIFWELRKRGGPVMFIERQIAHVWGAAIIATLGVFVVEWLLGLDVLRLSPVLALIAGMVFLCKAGMLSGYFYVPALLNFLTAIPMALFYEVGPLLFGLATAGCFFFPGLKYYRQRVRAARPAS